jgi:hypothetical protein
MLFNIQGVQRDDKQDRGFYQNNYPLLRVLLLFPLSVPQSRYRSRKWAFPVV